MITFKELRRSLDQAVCEQEIFKDISELLDLIEGTFYIFRTDTNQIISKGIPDYESAKLRAAQIRKSNNLKFDQISFKMERKPATQFGVSGDGKSYTNAHGQRSAVQYARSYNPSKGRRFRGYTDAQGNYHDID
ncbi:hypothetical protein KQ298_08950 [Synechococcus sp. CS-1330]|nr:hypothetical protein [Synechococcus sp. CS-1330]